jgi:hypothetical protein
VGTGAFSAHQTGPTYSGGAFIFSGSELAGTDLYFFEGIPEPSAMAMAVLAALGIGPSLRRRRNIAITRAFMLGSVVILMTSVGHAATTSDDFNDGSISNTVWSPPPDTKEDGDLIEQNGRLEFIAAVSTANTESSQAELLSLVTAPQNEDWQAQIEVFIAGASQFPGLVAGDLVASGFNVKPVTSTDGAAELNFGLVNPGTGNNTALRFATKSIGGDDETFDLLSRQKYATPRTATVRLLYDADNTMLTAYMDIGTGFFQQGNAVDTSDWGMGMSEEFFFSLFGTAGSFSDPPGHDFNVDSGESYFDNFELTVAAGGELTPPALIQHPRFDIPEPGGLALMGVGLCGMAGLLRRSRSVLGIPRTHQGNRATHGQCN